MTRGLALQHVRIAAAREATARLVLKAKIDAARGEGISLRDIAKEAGMSHEQVRRIVAR